MNKTELFTKFSQALKWNGFLFLVAKINKTVISFFLFYKLTTSDFSIWANLYSVIFLLMLWTDLGFSRSLPQYCIIFAKNSLKKKSFITKILTFKVFLSLGISVLLFIFAPKFIAFMHLPQSILLHLHLACLLFLAESIKSSLRVIYHSYFWQRPFNLIESITLLLQTFSTIIFISVSNPTTLISKVLLVDIISSLTIIITSLLIIRYLEADTSYQGCEPINTATLTNDFIRHSAVMWSLTSINSLTERNILLPFLTHIFGPVTANLFKLANDLSLLFQRFILKTIGTAGTSILAHIDSKLISNPTESDSALFDDAFLTLNKHIQLLTIPLLGILFFIYIELFNNSSTITIFGNQFFLNQPLLKLFIFLTLLYLLQIIFMAYDRLLEVKRNYKELFISFIPYIFIIIFFICGINFREFFYNTFSLIGILTTIHCMRFASIGIRIYYSHLKYKIKAPIKFLFKVSIITLTIIGSIKLILLMIAK